MARYSFLIPAVSLFSFRKSFGSPLLNLWLWGVFGGIPFLLTGSTLALWLKEEGVSLATLGFLTLLHLPYGLKFLWAPLFDVFSVPFLTRFWGKRPAWMLVCQGFVLLGLWGIGTSMVSLASPAFIALCFWISFWAASQDLLMQASQMDTLSRRHWGFGEASAVFGYRLGLFLSGACALYLSTFLAWETIWQWMSGICALGFFVTFLTPFMKKRHPLHMRPSQGADTAPDQTFSVYRSVLRPFQDFFGNPTWKMVLLLMLLYRLQDHLLGFFPQFFYLELGFSKEQLALVYKAFGMGAAALGGFMGGYWVRTKGYTFTLISALFLHMLSNAGFFIQSFYGDHLFSLYLTVGLEEVTKGLSMTAFFSYQLLCCRVSCVVTQLAILTALVTLEQNLLGGLSGMLVTSLGWHAFFMLTALASLPAIVLLYLQKIPYLTEGRPPN